MIRKKSEVKVDVHKDFRGGKGEVRFDHFMDIDMAQGAGRLFVKTTIPPGASVGIHKHEGDSEVYYILDGKAKLHDNGVDLEVGPGDVNFCPDGGCHGIENIGSGDLTYIAVILFTKQKETW